MKLKMSTISKAVSTMMHDLEKNNVLQDMHITTTKLTLPTGKEIDIPDKWWWVTNLDSFNTLGAYIRKVLDNESEGQDKTTTS